MVRRRMLPLRHAALPPPRRLRCRRLVALCAGLVFAAASPAAEEAPGADISELEALLNQPVYAASKFAQDAADAPASVTVLTAGDIAAFGWRTVAEVLNGVRGVYLRYDRFYDYAGVRGLSRPGSFSSRLLVLVDGMRVNDNIYDQAGIGREFPLDVALIERVEFIPGPGSALYGSSAVLGVVNIVTKSAAALRGGAAELELGSAGSRRIGFTQGREFGDASLVLGASAEVLPGRDLYYAEFDDAATNRGLTAGADRESDAKLYAKWSRGELTLSGLVSQRRKLIPTAPFATQFPSRGTFGIDRYAFAEALWQHSVGADEQWIVRANLAQYDFLGSFADGSHSEAQRLDQRGRWLGTEARWHYSGWRGQRLVVGAEMQRNLAQRQHVYWPGADGENFAAIAETSHRWGAFVNDEITLRADLRAVLGLRFDRHASGQRSATPRLALLWDAAPGLVVKALDGRAFREPNAYESQYQDDFLRLNPLLRSERLRASELAIDWRARSDLRLAASLYRYRAKDLIEQVFDESTTQLTYANVGAVTARGVEFEADHVATNGWRTRASWARQSANDASDGARLGNSPTVLGKLNVSVPLPAWQARLGFEWQWVGERLSVARAKLPSHAVANATLQVAPPGSRWSFSASVYNLFDKAYADPAGPEHVQDTIAQDARQWRAALALRF